MKKILILVIMICAVVLTTACSNSETSNVSNVPVIDESVTVEQSLKDNWEWNDFAADKVDYSVFPAWENGEESGYAYAVVSAKETEETLPVAVVYCKHNNDDLFKCPGTMLIDAEGGIEDGGSRIFGAYPIGENGAYRDICIGYSSSRWFSVEGIKTSCEENGLIIYLAEHGFEIQFGNREPKE